MKGKRLLILGAAFALGLSACASVTRIIRENPLRASGDESLFYTLTPATGSNNSYAGNCDVTIDGIIWNVTGNASLTPWRIGGKSITNTDRTVYSKTAMAGEITKVVLTVGAASSITVNSLDLVVASDSAFLNAIDNVSATFAANSEITFEPTNDSWAADSYYKFIFNVTVSGTSNKFVEFSKATFYSQNTGDVTYSVTYEDGGSTSGSVPSDSNEYESGDEVTVLGNTGNLAKEDHSFGGWSYAGESYNAGDKLLITSNIVFTAIWNYSKHYEDDTSANTITWDLSKPEYISASADLVEWNSPKATMNVAKANSGTASNNYLPPSQSSTRFYTGSVLTIAPVEGYQVDSVVFSSTTANYASALGGSSWTNATASVSDTVVTVVPSLKKNAISAVIGGTSGNTSVVVNYSVASSDPVLVLSKNEVTLKTNQSSGVVVEALVENVDSPTYLWSTNDSNIQLENPTTRVVTIKPNTTTEGSATVQLTVGGTTPNLTASVNVTIALPGPGESAETAYTVAQARAAIDSNEGVTGVYATGIVSKIVTAYNSQYGNISYDISSDGSTESDQLRAYRGKGIGGANFTSDEDIEVGATVVVYGDLTKYNSTYEFAENNQLVSIVRPSHSADYYVEKGSSFAALNAQENKSGQEFVVSKTISEIATENNYTISADKDVTCYKSLELDENVTVSTTGEDNCGSIWGTSTHDWRLYQNKEGNVTVTAKNGYNLSSVKFVFSATNTGKLSLGNTSIASGETIRLSSNSATFVVGNTGSATNGQIRISSIEVSYGNTTLESVDSVQLRFGASFAEADWNAILNDENLEIEEYGVKLFTSSSSSFASATPVQDAIEAGKTPASVSKAYSTPLEVENGMIKFVSIINIKAESAYGTIFCAAPFVRINGKDYFLDEKQYSVNSLAQELLNNEDYSSLSQDALNVLAGN